ncbi:hypothetical protein [Candidatus Chloroploca sp. Khr17]|uniref:hypothetical protein n=1 Tax=Candidatus Chloroploca sp. Khr17 TaxID=2496869 RepID=UPI001F1061A3|nr:hypothetical protein [Candidatus Chloroploca sp. Khr17]
MVTMQPPPDDVQAIVAASDERLKTIFPAPALVWIVDEHYDASGPLWRVTLVCQEPTGQWVRRRYRYDVPSDTLHFAGAQPINEQELLAARRKGRRLVVR